MVDELEGNRFETCGKSRDRVLVAGCGAVGTVVGCLLAADGCRVEAIGRGEHFAVARREGLRVVGIWGEHHAVLDGYHDGGHSVVGEFDAVLVACKGFQTEDLLGELSAACLAPSGRVISLQNGLGNVERLAAVFGEERSLAARVIFGAEIPCPGTARVTVEAAPTLLGRTFVATEDEGAREWAERFSRASIPAQSTTTILAALWGKVFYNAALNPLGALLGLPYGELPQDPERRRVMDQVIEEAFAVAVADGVDLPWPSAQEYRRVFYDQLLPPTVRHRSSMLRDLERGRPTEIEAICGEICRRADEHGLDVWANRVLLALVRGRSSAA